MKNLQKLNQYRIDAERNFNELEQIRDRHMNSISRVDSKMNDYYGIINAIRTEMNLLIVKEEISISVEVLNLHDAEDNQVLMAKIDIPSFPPIYKSFFGITYSLFQISGNESLNDFSIQGRIKELAIEWLKEKRRICWSI